MRRRYRSLPNTQFEASVPFPLEVAVDNENGSIYVSETVKWGVQIFDKNGNVFGMIDSNISSRYKMWPLGLDVNFMGDLIIADVYNNRVLRIPAKKIDEIIEAYSAGNTNFSTSKLSAIESKVSDDVNTWQFIVNQYQESGKLVKSYNLKYEEVCQKPVSFYSFANNKVYFLLKDEDKYYIELGPISGRVGGFWIENGDIHLLMAETLQLKPNIEITPEITVVNKEIRLTVKVERTN
ncbi:MAG: hypothetical protein AB1765_04385, partial [Candidatus Hydrogenedentota bacterium]